LSGAPGYLNNKPEIKGYWGYGDKPLLELPLPQGLSQMSRQIKTQRGYGVAWSSIGGWGPPDPGSNPGSPIKQVNISLIS
jgi:hypothetical protein